MVEIAQQLLDPVAYVRDFQPLSLDAQQTLLAKRLRAEHHLLILDNLESITGANLAIQHTLDQPEQNALRSFVAALKGGHTLVLLGSRGGETWLAKGTFDDSIYTLNGLDPEAASTLADLILKKHHATHYRDNDDLRRLLTLLDGFPLALEVVLPNLVHTTPGEILSALQAGDVQLDTAENKQQGKDIFEQKTESILRCIDYSHSNLAPEAQQLLLCLAPFTSVFNIGLLDQYITHLKQQTLLTSLPFDRFQEVLQEAANWGLLSPDPDDPRLLHLQPTLPYFLRNHVSDIQQAPYKVAVETAFREHYEQLSGMLHQLLNSKAPQERLIGVWLTGLEYENLVTALNLAVASQEEIGGPFNALMRYFSITQNQQQGLEMFQTIENRLAAYPTDKLSDSSAVTRVYIIGAIANWQLHLKQFEIATASYQKLLDQLDLLTSLDERTKDELRANTYHQLGNVAQEQHQWAKAEQYYHLSLQIDIDINDRYAQAKTYHQLGNVAQEQRRWSQAELYYQHALQLKIEFKARYEQAVTYHQLGVVAQMQHQLVQAGQYYQYALQLYIEFNDRYEQAKTYHNLGIIAQEEGQGSQAELYYQHALQLYIGFNDRYLQASTYHQLGRVAQEQRQWSQAEQYYQHALQLFIEFNARDEQASTYGQLGLLAQEQQQWIQARDYLLQALEIFVEFKDEYSLGIALRGIAGLWRGSGDASILAMIAKRLGLEVSEVEKLLREKLEESSEGEKANGNEG